MKLVPIISLILLCCPLSVILAPRRDRVDYSKLKNYPYDKTKLYSGYLSVEGTINKLHYLLVESQNQPSTDPLLLWLNGGPGCSSLLGFASENGPAIIDDDDPKNNKVNEFSWNLKANVLYLEAPAGVGYSYPKQSEYNDDTTAAENLKALINFFTDKFPEYQSRDFYISGESYAGIYIPTLANKILEFNKTAPQESQINLKGLLIGNGIVDWKIEGDSSMYDILFTHSFYSIELREKYMEDCKKYPWSYQSIECNNIKDNIIDQIGPVFMYDTIQDCYYPGNEIKDELIKSKKMKNVYSRTPWLSHRYFKGLKSKKSPYGTLAEDLGDYECLSGNGVDDFYNDEEVKEALNIYPGLNWNGCSELTYYMGDIGTFYLYPKLIESGLKIWLYAGDTDAVVPFNGTVTWLEKLKRPIKKEWSPWRIVDDYICGYSIEYEGITFLTVRGTGHMVPQWKRAEAYHMVDAFLYGKDL